VSPSTAAGNGVTTGAWRAVPWSAQLAWQHPEWWMLAISLGAWLVLIFPGDAAATASLCLAPLPNILARSTGGIVAAILTAGWPGHIGHWLLMVAAMMLPLVIIPVRHVAFRSLWRRRHRAIGGFLIGYIAIWGASGLAALAILAATPESSIVAAVAFAIAALWQLTPWKQQALRACHRTVPLAPHGWRADFGCIRYGALLGRHCMVSCWAVMLASMLTPNVAAIGIVSAVYAAERYRPRTSRVAVAAVLALVAIGFAITRQL
jgi:predicted metal-binding membrane protein